MVPPLLLTPPNMYACACVIPRVKKDHKKSLKSSNFKEDDKALPIYVEVIILGSQGISPYQEITKQTCCIQCTLYTLSNLDPPSSSPLKHFFTFVQLALCLPLLLLQPLYSDVIFLPTVVQYQEVFLYPPVNNSHCSVFTLFRLTTCNRHSSVPICHTLCPSLRPLQLQYLSRLAGLCTYIYNFTLCC